jgi:hypothetical protein
MSARFLGLSPWRKLAFTAVSNGSNQRNEKKVARFFSETSHLSNCVFEASLVIGHWSTRCPVVGSSISL